MAEINWQDIIEELKKENKIKIDKDVIDKEFKKIGPVVARRGDGDMSYFLEGLCGIDLTNADVSKLDAVQLKRMTFDDRTIFPENEYGKKLEDARNKILNKGKFSQSLSDLHNQEITTIENEITKTSKLDGSGIKMGFIDTGFDEDMSEVKDKNGDSRVKCHLICKWDRDKQQYVVVPYQGESAVENNWHGNTVTDLAAGKECGIAPNADIYLFEISREEGKYEDKVEAILQYIADNNINLDIISHSAGASDKALKRTEQIKANTGCEFIDSNIFWTNFFPGRENEQTDETAEAGFVKSAREVDEILEDEKGSFLNNEEAMAIPVEGRTSIQVIKDESGNVIGESRKFNGAICGASFAIAQVAAYFALARQLNPKITMREFVKKAQDLAKINSEKKKIIDPKKIIKRMLEERKTEKQFTINDIGKATVNEPTGSKVKAKERVDSDRQSYLETVKDKR